MIRVNKPAAIIPPYLFTGTVVYDQKLRKRRIQEFLENRNGKSCNIHFKSKYGVDYIVVFENEAQKYEPHFSKRELKGRGKRELLELASLLGKYFNKEFSPYKKSHLIKTLLEVTHVEYYTAHYNNPETAWCDLEATHAFRGRTSTEVIALMALNNSVHYIQEDLENLFYKNPLGGEVVVYEGTNLLDTIPLYGNISDAYTVWDRDIKNEVIASIMASRRDEPYAAALTAYLEEALPVDLRAIGTVEA